MNTNEVFKYVTGSRGEMQVSNKGNILVLNTIEYTDENGNKCSSENWQHIEGRPDKDGYLQVTVPHVGIRFIHSLVAIEFVKKPTVKEYYGSKLFIDPYITNERFQEALEVNHIDGGRKNNNATNLEWITHADNTSSRKKHNKGNKKKVPVKVLDMNHNLIEICPTIKEAGKKYDDISKGGVCGAHISKCVRGLIPSFKGHIFVAHIDSTTKLF